MSFLDRLCRRVRPEPPVDEATVTELVADAQAQHRRALQRRSTVDALTSRVDAKARRNHFGETVDQIYRRRHA